MISDKSLEATFLLPTSVLTVHLHRRLHPLIIVVLPIADSTRIGTVGLRQREVALHNDEAGYYRGVQYILPTVERRFDKSPCRV